MSSSKTTYFCWPIDDFGNQRWKAYKKNKNLASDAFTLNSCLAIKFALLYQNHESKYWDDHSYGVVLRNIGSKESIEFDLKIWLENEDGKKFGEYSAQKQVFNKVGDQCAFNVKTVGKDWDLLAEVDEYGETLFICCELLDLNSHDVPVVNCDNEFHQNFWKLYEREMHDAVIKVGDKKFKVFKFLFMAQSPVFERMFTSNFKESVTSTINVKDIEEETMQHLIKWFYTNRIEKDSPIDKLFIAADKYDVKLLKSTCVQLMTNSFDSVNAFSRLIFAIQHNDQVLKKAALSFIAKLPSIDYVKFLTSAEWNDLYNKSTAIAQEVRSLFEEKLEK